MGGAAGMAEIAGSVDYEGVVVSDGGAGGVAAGWVVGDCSVATCGGAVVAVRAGVARSEKGAGSGGSARSSEGAPPGAGEGRCDGGGQCDEDAGEDGDGGADGEGGDAGGGDEAGGVDGGS
jgi:hypothetical protein